MNLNDLETGALNHVGEGLCARVGFISARVIVFKVRVDGTDYWIAVNHGNYPEIAQHVKAAFENRYGSNYNSFEVVESYEFDMAGKRDTGFGESHAQQREIQALNVDPTPNYNGQVHEIDGRKYRLTLEGDQ